MEDAKFLDMFALLSERWQQALSEKRYHDALMIGLVGFVCARESGDQQFQGGEAAFLVLIENTIRTASQEQRDRPMTDERGQPLCSFCGQGEPAVRLVAGANANICVPCAKLVVDIGADQQRPEG